MKSKPPQVYRRLNSLAVYFYALSAIGHGRKTWAIDFARLAKISENNLRQMLYRGCSEKASFNVITAYQNSNRPCEEWVFIETGRGETVRCGVCHTVVPRFIVMEDPLDRSMYIEWIDQPERDADLWEHLVTAVRKVRRVAQLGPTLPDAPDAARWEELHDYDTRLNGSDPWRVFTGSPRFVVRPYERLTAQAGQIVPGDRRTEWVRLGDTVIHTFDPRFIVRGSSRIEWLDQPMNARDAWEHLCEALGRPLAGWHHLGDWSIHPSAVVAPDGTWTWITNPVDTFETLTIVSKYTTQPQERVA